MTPLGEIIAAEIEQTGPISISRYMSLCLSHPAHGYYTTKDPIGAKGDFTTAPEVSQLFGEMIGIWLLQAWIDRGSPSAFTLAELGPGRGTLMADILRVVGKHDQFSKAMRLVLVETSPNLRQAQSTALGNQQLEFANDIKELPDQPLFLVANEFFDALPVNQFLKTDIGWQERLISHSPSGFDFTLGNPQHNHDLDAMYPLLANGRIVERSVNSEGISAHVGAIIAKNGGAALVIDYGEQTGVGDTFQAVKNHGLSDVLKDQGMVDLTTHVQFQPLARASNCDSQFASQGVFLENMGITARAQQLLQNIDGTGAEAVIAGHRRLVHPDEMGTLFKVLALRKSGTAEFIGFEA